MMHDVRHEYFSLPKNENVGLKLEGLHFVPHKNPRCQVISTIKTRYNLSRFFFPCGPRRVINKNITRRDHNFQNIQEFFKLCFQIAIDNTQLMVKTDNVKLKVIQNVNGLKSFKQIVKECNTLKVVTSFSFSP